MTIVDTRIGFENWRQCRSLNGPVTLALLVCGLLAVNLVAAVPDGNGRDDDLNSLTTQIDQSNQTLSSLRDQIRNHRDQISALAAEENDAAQELQNLNREMGLVKNLLAGLNERETMLQQQIDTLRVHLLQFEVDYQRQQQQLARRIRALYVHGPRRHLELVLTAESFTSLVTRLKYAAIMGRQDRKMMDQIRANGQQILTAQSQFQEALVGIWEAREEANQERLRLQQVDQERRTLLTYLQRERQLAETGLAGLRAREGQLTKLLADLERQREARAKEAARPDASPSAFARQAGSLTWPVNGQLIRGFGRSVHPVYKTVTLNNGINIAAPRGAPVYAVAAGRVEFADHLPGFGVCVILDHGAGYYSLYAHLDRVFVAKGSRIDSNEILAEVGEAAEEGGSQLYFEIRQGKTPLDPTEWLRTRRP